MAKHYTEMPGYKESLHRRNPLMPPLYPRQPSIADERHEVYPHGSWIRKLAFVWLGFLLLTVAFALGSLAYLLAAVPS